MHRREFLAAVTAVTVSAPISETARRSAIPFFGGVVNYLNENHGTDLYIEAPSESEEFVGRIEMSEGEFEELLIDGFGLRVNPVASRKYREARDGKEYEEGSFRLVSGPQSRKQLHVRVYDGNALPNADTGYVLLYAHWEYRWDTDPWKHYRGEEWNAQRGVRRTRYLLQSHAIDYDTTPASVE